MKYLHIKKLEEYNPGYKDNRYLYWCKAHFKMLNADPEFEMLGEIDKWRFLAFVMLEMQVKKPIPLDEEYLSRKGFDFTIRTLKETVFSMKESIEILSDLMQHIENTIVTEELEVCTDQNCVDNSELCIEKRREEKNREEKRRTYVDFEKSTLLAWNSFCDKFPVLSKVKEISGKRREKLKKRFEVESFRDFSQILLSIEAQNFLLGSNERGWKISFDWLLENDTNYLKVLEFKYGKNAAEDSNPFLSQWKNKT